jgi:hypothetical protein
MKELTDTASVSAFRQKFEAGRSFDLDDDMEFCPALLTETDVSSLVDVGLWSWCVGMEFSPNEFPLVFRVGSDGLEIVGLDPFVFGSLISLERLSRFFSDTTAATGYFVSTPKFSVESIRSVWIPTFV